MKKEKIIEVKDLRINFATPDGDVYAIRGVDFDVYRGETLAIVGESGSGKSVTTKSILGMLDVNAKIQSGEILYSCKECEEKQFNIITMDETELSNKIRGKRIAMIFQDPMTSLNPTMKIGRQILESVLLHTDRTKEQAKARVIELLTLVGIKEPELKYNQYPHQFSGGMRQRVVIAIALAGEPDLLIADEPTTALDVTIQAQILETINDIKEKTGVSIIFITHDLGVVANIADRVAVMYAGKIVEYGLVDEIFYEPVHPYTWGLLASMPDLETEGSLYAIPGTPPNLMFPPKGDAFAYRNEQALEIDFLEEPPMFKVTNTHYAATWNLHEYAPEIKMPEILQHRLKKLGEE